MRLPASGFTLIELMVSLTVLAILAMVATPSYLDFFDRTRVRGAADDVVSLVANARAEAVKNDLDVSLAMTGSGTAWCLGGNASAPPSGGDPAADADPCDCSDSTDCVVSGQRFAVDSAAYPEVSVSAPLGSALVLDGTLGALTPLAAHGLTLTSPSGKYDVRVEMSGLGLARLCTPAGKPTMSAVPPC